jgi:hypothetical protein
LPFTPGDKGEHLYESRDALPLIYAVDNLEAARAAQARGQALLNAVREEDLRKQRIPIQIVLDFDRRGFSIHRINDQDGQGKWGPQAESSPRELSRADSE